MNQRSAAQVHRLQHVLLGATVVVSTASIVGGIVTLAAANAQGTTQDKIVICHATGSQTNPYNVIEIARSSIDPQQGNSKKYLEGHGDHTGPVWTSGAASWGDIIPPFSSDEGNAFPGYNWSSAGQAILLNGCAAVVPSPTPTQTSASPTPTDTSASPSPTDTSATAVPAGSGDIVLSVMGIVLLVAGVAGLVASIVWMVARRRPAA